LAVIINTLILFYYEEKDEDTFGAKYNEVEDVITVLGIM
jgi:hypothetical protein